MDDATSSAVLPAPLTRLRHIVHGANGEHTITDCEALDLSHPCLFFFGGNAYQGRGREAALEHYEANLDLLTPQLGQQLRYYTLTSKVDTREKRHLHALAKNMDMDYCMDPKHFVGPEAAAFVAQYVQDRVPDMTGQSQAEQEAAAATLAREFSNITFFGYSHGTVVVQEIRNALDALLEERGFAVKQRASILSAIAAVNIGPGFIYTAKYPDFSQATFLSHNDLASMRETRISPNNPDIDFERTSDHLRVAKGPHTLILANGSGTPTLRRIMTPADTEGPDRYNSIETDAHSKAWMTARLRQTFTPEGMVTQLPDSMIALNVARFLTDFLDGSQKALTEGTIRPTAAILEAAVDTHLSKEQARGDDARIRFFTALYDGLASPNAPQRS